MRFFSSRFNRSQTLVLALTLSSCLQNADAQQFGLEGQEQTAATATDGPLVPPLPSTETNVPTSPQSSDGTTFEVIEPIPLPGPSVEHSHALPQEPVCAPEVCGWRGHLQAWKRKMQACYWGYPEYFEEQPLGAAVYSVRDQMIRQGVRDQLFLHQMDFYSDESRRGNQLTAYGVLRLQELAQKSMACGFPLRIESTVGHPDLDEARRQYVIKFCETQGVGIPSDMIVIDTQHRGLSGPEAAAHHRRLIERSGGGGGGESSGASPVPTLLPATSQPPAAR